MGQNGWLIYSKKDAEKNRSYIEWFIKEARLQNLRLQLILREDLTIGIINQENQILLNNISVNLPDFAVVRTVEPLLSLHFESCGIRVFNSSFISNMCNHKALTYREMNKLNIPMVHTIFIHKKNLGDPPPLDYPFIIKESLGRSGQQVYFIETDEDWSKCKLTITSEDLVVQTCDVQLGKDIRVFVIGKEIIGAVMRESFSDFRANFNLGGSATWYPLNDHEISLIHKIIQSYDFDLVGIDFLVGHDGSLLFNEIEDVVGSRILSATSHINLLERYVTHIKKELSK